MHTNATETRARTERAGGIAALYLSLALLAAIPYFLVLVDYPGAATPADKVNLIVDNYPSMYTVYLATYLLFGLAVGVLALSLHDRLREAAPLTSRVTTVVGLTWSFALVASGLIFTYGLTSIHDIAATDFSQSVSIWQAIEPVALALGGGGGELLGGLWVLLVSGLGLKAGIWPKALAWLGVVAGLIGLISVIPPLHDAGIAFGLLEIVWLAWVAGRFLRSQDAPGVDVPKDESLDPVGTFGEA
ncbi:MAG: DUF4386 family protein [Myxococcales bacterium]|nr:DUF4386 family protein [Myxococcales bacterium]